MRRRTISLLLGGLGLLVMATPAAAQPRYVGGCASTVVRDRVGNPWDDRGTFRGELDVELVVTDADGTPLAATVSCFLTRNGVEEPGTRLTVSGTGPLVGARLVAYTLTTRYDHIDLCQEVDVAGPTPPESLCYTETSICDTVCMLGELSAPYRQEACAETVPLAAADLGVARVEDDGDVWVDHAVDFSCWPDDDAQ